MLPPRAAYGVALPDSERCFLGGHVTRSPGAINIGEVVYSLGRKEGDAYGAGISPIFGRHFISFVPAGSLTLAEKHSIDRF
jgi:hypothetical protein